MNSSLRFSVIIPTYHRNESLVKCLDCLAPEVQTLPAEQYDVIVTDDGSQTTAQQIIREHYPWVKWVAGPGKGPAANRNNGVKYAQGEWLVFTDDDCLPEPNWLYAFANATTESVLALEGAIHPLGDLNQDLAECPVNITGGYFWSANIAVRRSLLEKVGGFDANYLRYHEDQDLKLRICGYTTIPFVPEARVSHPVRLISLTTALNRIPKQCIDWAYYFSTNRQALGYKSNLNIILGGYKFYFMVFIRNLRQLRLKSACVILTILLIGVPISWRHLFRLSPKS